MKQLAGTLSLTALAVFSLFGVARAQDVEALRAEQTPPNAIALDSLDLAKLTQDFGEPQRAHSVDGKPLKLKGVTYPHGIGTHAASELIVNLKGAATKFVSMVGLDDERTGQGSVTFEVWVDGKKAAETGVLKGGDEPKLLSVDLTGAKRLILRVGDGGDGIANDHADWAGALLYLVPGAAEKPESGGVPVSPPRYVPAQVSPEPRIHGPRVVGATPGRPFLFLIPTTGEGPLAFAARGLPAGLQLDPQTGIITGSLTRAGTTEVQLTVRGAKGATHRKLTIVGGEHKLAQTPPMGWNSWNCWAGAVDAAKVRAAADAMVKSGLASHGFQYVNIDDTWEGDRGPNGDIRTNDKFPDMKALSDYVHGKGLKIGIYSSPGPKTCAGFAASYQYEDQDARTYAHWGMDYLKYDWCSYTDVATGEGLERLQKPYRRMRDALDKADRDILYSLCQYGMGDVWKWGDEVGGNAWRTTGDITDTWSSLKGIYQSQAGHEQFAGPGHWNDPDMLVVGKVGWGPSLHPSHLSPNEQILHISMWCMLSSPLLIGCDMSQMEPFTVDLLSNDEVLDVNQDPLGKPAGLLKRTPEGEVWSRRLFDGTTAVALVNPGSEPSTVAARWSDLGLKGLHPVRDLWLHKDLGPIDAEYAAEVPAHGVVLVKIGKPKGGD